MFNKIPMTLRGFNKLKSELKKLKYITRPCIVKAIANARQLGDLKENAEYHSAREEQSFCENRICEIENKLLRAQIIDITKIPFKGIVIFGSTVTVLQISTSNIFVYTIVGDDEANYKEFSISIHSPMSRALIGKKKNDIIKVNTPTGYIKYIIKKIEYI
ncbi:transcription elongation factor GreA [Buchnera aphidicola]|uniref:Transcription elongation factor GreA n=1 Tax=Buchnera aphidicola subsp. Cinara cedri (strain Cc) TaxID=372461 RepID=GREA_BUCCC|nr:transcription elongation factor GreA [Buchnera aphidicola]Q057J4.1 RecName: Full=Transcription elongation factor GreA; AltName: Full=Transcript cleavage factor GreA [Buchnera aphidicola BCc]ABJ90705.1 transcription elongation factor [Buchnera aphidicola BCc]